MRYFELSTSREHLIFPYSISRPSRIPTNNGAESRLGWTKIQEMLENIHLNLIVVLLFICTEVECGKGLYIVSKQVMRTELLSTKFYRVITINNLCVICASIILLQKKHQFPQYQITYIWSSGAQLQSNLPCMSRINIFLALPFAPLTNSHKIKSPGSTAILNIVCVSFRLSATSMMP